MDLNTIEIEKTSLLFFDVLNGYYHEASDAAKQKKKAHGRQRRAFDEDSAESRHADSLCKGQSS